MDFLLELVAAIFIEVPLEATMESKRVKTWVKTMVFFLVGNILTVILAFIALDGSQESGVDALTIGIGIIWFLAVTALSIYGHKRKWTDQSDTPSVKAVEIPRNVPKSGLIIRTATMADLEAITQVEAVCFPVAEAATEQEFRERLSHYADHFWLMFDGE